MRLLIAVTIGVLCYSNASANEAVVEPKLAVDEIVAMPALPESMRVDDPVAIVDFLAQFQVRIGESAFVVESAYALADRTLEQQALERLLALEQDPAVAQSLISIAAVEPVYDSRTEGMRGRGPARYFRAREDQLVQNLIALQRPMLQSALQPSENESLRVLTQRLKIDPYTTHPLLRARLDRIARAMADDGQLAEIILNRAQPPESSEVSINAQLWQQSPEVLKQQGIQGLMAMGVAQRASQRFFDNPYVSPTLGLRWLKAQKALGPVAGADAMVMLGAAAESEAEIRMLIEQLVWAGQYAYKDDPIMGFNVQRQAPGFRTRGNRIVVLLPVDYLSWTPAFADFAVRPDMLGTEKLIWISGDASAAAVAGLSEAGWQVRTKVAYQRQQISQPD